MKTAKLLRDAGSGCCLLLPLLGGSATAGPLVSTDIPTEFDLTSFHQGSQLPTEALQESLISVEAALEPTKTREDEWTVDLRTLNLHASVLGQPDEDFVLLEKSDRNIVSFNALDRQLSENTLSENTVDDLDATIPDSVDDRLETTAYNNGSRDGSTFGALLVELHTESSLGVQTLVKGAEDGSQAIAFDNWLIPFDDVVNALGFTASVEVDGQISLRSAEITTKIQLESLPKDPELGVMWSVADIAKHLGAAAEFDRQNYAIRFNRDAVNRDRSIQAVSNRDDLPYAALSATYVTDNSSPQVPLDQTGQLVDQTGQLEAKALSTSIDQNESNPLLLETDSMFEMGLAREQLASAELASADLGVLLVGLNVGEITTVEATLVKGRENGLDAVSFDDWLVPFDDAMTALGVNVTPEEDGLLFVRAPGLATAIDPQMLTIDSEIGRAISIAEIEQQLGIAAEFDRSQYAIRFSPPVADRSANRFSQWFQGERVSEFAETDGLPAVVPSAFSLSAITQSTRASSSGDRLLNEPLGQLSAVGSVFGGSWYARLNQPSLTDYRRWQIKELQYFRPSEREDYVLGSQPTFWQASNANQDYWGATMIQRWGFAPPQTRSTGGFSPRSRLQADEVGRTVSGEAAPGTFVRLTRGLNGAIVDETIVNSSGIYRFEDVPAIGQLGDRHSNRGYLVQLYANGQLNSQPEVRSATFTTLPGQLPKGASALVTSAGMGYRSKTDRAIGDFNTFRGGVAYRYGLSEELTLGAGLVQDGTTQVLTEGFYIPEKIPLKAAFSATVDIVTGEAEVDANVRYQPTQDLRLTFDSDRFSQRLAADWTLAPNFSLTATGDSRENTLSLEANAAYETDRWRGSAMAAVDTDRNLRWSLYGTNGPLSLSHQGSEVSTYSTVRYNLSNESRRTAIYGTGHEIALSYQTLNNSAQTLELSTGETISVGQDSGSLATAEWRYRSPQLTFDGRSRWEFSLGYGVSDNRSGPIASATASLNSGLDLQMRYQSTSIFDESENLQISLVSRLDTRNGLGWGHRRQNELRTKGGIKLQPFFDDDLDGVRDEGEALYLESPELLFLVNQGYIDKKESKLYDDGISMSLPPDTYRLDINPAGLPIDKSVLDMSYAVTVVPGQYTKVAVPLVTTYSVSGVVVDENGFAVAGAQVEAIGTSGHRQQSTTNGAGVYYLERLRPETYAISVDGVLLEDNSILLEEESDTFLEQEIRLL